MEEFIIWLIKGAFIILVGFGMIMAILSVGTGLVSKVWHETKMDVIIKYAETAQENKVPYIITFRL